MNMLTKMDHLYFLQLFLLALLLHLKAFFLKVFDTEYVNFTLNHYFEN